ncbi:MAG: hypothetical protein ABIO82_01240 [Ginsengibacter sp.]
MEEEFYLDDFELSLQEQMNQLKMVPSKKVWYGIYNDLHPGRRWPSVMISLILIFSIVFVGYINTSPDKNAADKSTIAAGEQHDISITNNLQRAQAIPGNGKFQDRKDNGVTATRESELQNKKAKEENTTVSASSEAQPVAIVNLKADAGNKVSDKGDRRNVLSQGVKPAPLTQAKTLLPQHNGIFSTETPLQNYSGIVDAFSAKGIAEISNIPGIFEGSPVSSLLYSFASEQVENQFTRQVIPNVSFNSNLIITGIVATPLNKFSSSSEVGRKTKKKNEKISWVYYAGVAMSNVAFKGQPLKNSALNSTLVASGPQRVQKDMRVIRSAALGFEAGLQMNYAIISNIEFTVGANITRSGYNIVSNLVHPTLSNLILKDPSTGGTFTRGFVTHYGDGTGISSVILHNYSYQASIPVGLQYMVWANDKLQVKLGLDVEPSYVINADAFVLSSNGKNYVEVPDLLRKWNVGSNFAPFVSFRSHKLKWNVGPNIRYQWLSSYEKSYPVKEHLIDYGIRVGISK